MKHEGRCECHPEGRIRGLIQPWILLLLAQSPSHGYELLEKLGSLGVRVDPGALYRALRAWEEEGLVQSSWETASGPARRVYTLTDSGWEYLRAWAVHLRRLRDELDRFLGTYERLKGGEENARA